MLSKISLLFKITLIYILIIISSKYISPLNKLFFNQPADLLPINQAINVTGKIVNIAENSSKKANFILELKEKKHKIYINIYNPERKFFYGDILKISGKAKLPKERTNPGGFDQKEILSYENIYQIINANGKNVQKIGFNPNSKIKFHILSIRENLILKIKKYLSYPIDAVFLGIFLGETNEIPKDINDSLKEGGISHILSVSGLHVGILSFIIYLLLSPLPIAPRYRAIINIFLIFFYTILTGASETILRAALMVTSLHLSAIFNRNTNIVDALCLSLLIILVISPLSLFSISLILSYSITFCLIVFAPIFEKLFLKFPNYLQKSLAVTCAASLGAIPLSLYFFNIISPISFFLNLTVVPIVGIIMSVGVAFSFSSFLFSSITLILSEIIKILTVLMIKITSFCISIPYAYFYLPAPNIILIISFFIFIFLIFHDSDIIKKIGIFQILIILNYFIWKEILFFNGWMLKADFIDVGQGDAIYLTLPGNKNVLIDTGPNGHEIIQHLHNNGVNKIDALIITHPDRDHVGGFYEIINNFSIEKIYFNLPKLEKLTNEELNFIKWMNSYNKYYSVYFNEKILISPFVETIILNPKKDMSNLSQNNNSLVLHLKYKNFSMFFSGDIEKKAEEQIVNSNLLSGYTILKIAHHGSKYSSSDNFLQKSYPEISIISVGRNNNFGHPNILTIQKLKQIKSKIYRTDKDGMITIITDGIYYKVEKYLNSN